MSRFLAEPDVAAYVPFFGSAAVKAAIDGVLRSVRSGAASAGDETHPIPHFAELCARVLERLEREESAGLLPVINGTGILLHTNLGRAPLAAEAVSAVAALGSGYSNLEFDLEPGMRGSRYDRLGTLLRATTGAQDGLIVNNCAAAVLLILDTFARGVPRAPSREVVVSRNQLIEIGGGFRLPDVLARSGAALVEVGATNKVYLSDFERALSARTALFLRSHTSNYRIEGFVADVAPAELAALAKRAGVASAEDLGSGALVDVARYGLPHERTVAEAVADGIDLVAFSGDKLLGGPQAGIVVGKASAIARLRANPLLRALRVDKATLAALGATLRLYVEPGALERIPLYAMLAATPAALRDRALALVAALGAMPRQTSARAVATEAFAGGGSAPLAPLPSYGVEIRGAPSNAGALAARLRRGSPHLIARVAGEALIVDLRSIPPQRDRDVQLALAAALGAAPA
ncbi:MAG: L-seryl-tRNA(Sec) selenium transferase [Candidatus Eremiobacteraeota bacterium]|nr:L-seryl-tRNA(Sec) selenium transferase [Candidatus Eremiobacteraeota bacterium]